jgi:hypothetical protein
MPSKPHASPCCVCEGPKDQPCQPVCSQCRDFMRELDRLHEYEPQSLAARRAKLPGRRARPTRAGCLRWAGRLPLEGR